MALCELCLLVRLASWVGGCGFSPAGGVVGVSCCILTDILALSGALDERVVDCWLWSGLDG